MSSPLVSRREAVLWAACCLVVSALLVALRFTSDDPDSDLYAGLSAGLVGQPFSRWIAPEWWGLWPRIGLTGPYQDHPVGAFLLPAFLGRLGVPGEQAAYIVGVGMGLAALLLIGDLVRRLVSRDAARATLILLQFMPVAFVFRVRANQEYAMLVCLLVTMLGLDRVRESWRGLAWVAAALSAALLIKGVFVVFTLAGGAVWIALNPTRTSGSTMRPVVAIGVSLVVLSAVALGYDAWYRRATGEGYWAIYWQLQMGKVTLATPVEGASTLARHVGFYVARLLWHPAPWSLALVAAAWLHRSSWRSWWQATPESARRGLLFALGYAGLLVVMLSPSSRFAERYIFSGTYAIATAGVVVACRSWPRIGEMINRLDRRIVALPVLLWFVLIVARLGVGPWMRRI